MDIVTKTKNGGFGEEDELDDDEFYIQKKEFGYLTFDLNL